MTRPAADLTDDEIRMLASHIARLCLEVERGLRSPDHLRQLADPHKPSRWTRALKVGRFHGGPPVPADIGPPHLSRIREDHAVVTVVTRTEGLRWGAITLQLRARGTTWHIADLQRLLAAAHYRSGQARAPVDEMSLDEKIQRASAERRLVGAALATVRRRLRDLHDPDARRGAIQSQADYLQRALGDLDRELLDLCSRDHARLTVEQMRRHLG